MLNIYLTVITVVICQTGMLCLCKIYVRVLAEWLQQIITLNPTCL